MSFNKTLFERLKKNKNLEDSSIKTYLQSIKKISKELFNSTKPNLLYFKDYSSVLEYLDNIPSISSRKGLATSIIVVLKSDQEFSNNFKNIIEKYTDYHKNLSSIQNDMYLDNEKTEKEEKNWVSNEDIKKKIADILDILSNKTGNIPNIKPVYFLGTNRNFVDLYQQYLVLNLYTMIPPIRNDYGNCRIITDADGVMCNNEFNYINISSSKLFLCSYKTSKKYGLKEITIPEELLKIIKKYEILKKNLLKYTGGFMLINTTNLQPMLKNSLTKFINKIFIPKKVSTTILRKSYISWRFPVHDSMRERMDVADVMGHSVGISQKVYSKKM